jgi:16S rRNA (cytosine1402-N4)-methyltransferase
MVKNYLKSGNVSGEPVKDFYGNIERPWDVLTRKPIEPGGEELKKNARARSSRLRVAVKQ